jgi:hypothetical protein
MALRAVNIALAGKSRPDSPPISRMRGTIVAAVCWFHERSANPALGNSIAQEFRVGSVDYGHQSHGEVGRRNPATLVTRTLKRCCSVVPSRFMND